MDFKFYFICIMIYVVFPLVSIVIMYKAIKDIKEKKRAQEKIYAIDIIKVISAVILIALAVLSFVFLFKVLHTFPVEPGPVIID